MASNEAPDLIHGYSAIAAHLGISRSAAESRARSGDLPTFRQGTGTAIYARRSELDRLPPVSRGRPRCNDIEDRRAASEARRAIVRAEQQEIRRLIAERQKADFAAAGLLCGMKAIASYLGLTVRQALHLHENGRLPTFRMGRTVCARRSTLAKHFARMEREAG